MTTHPDLAEALDPAVATDPLADADLLYGEVEEDLRATVRGLLRDRLDPAAQIRALDSEAPHDRELEGCFHRVSSRRRCRRLHRVFGYGRR